MIAAAFLGAAGGYLLRGTDDLEASEWNHCVDPEAGYDVAYPPDWHRGGTVSDQQRAGLLCRFFDPEPFNIPPASDFFGAALEVHVADATYGEAVAALTDARFYDVALREERTLAGHRALRFEVVSTGEGLQERGTRTYGYLIRRFDGPPVTVQTTQTPYRTIVDRAARMLRLFAVPERMLLGVPEPVAEKHAAIRDALDEGDMNALAALADRTEFTYTFGGPAPGGPAAYWRELEANGTPVREILAAILDMPYTLAQDHYVWPFAYDVPTEDLTPHERDLLEPLGDEASFGPEGYLGWRVGIRPDGRWTFFVAGD